MLKKTVQVFCRVALIFAVLIVTFLIVFPYFAHTKQGRRRPTPAELALREEQRQNLLRAKDRLHLAMASGTPKDVAYVWHSISDTAFGWDVNDHFAYARYLLRKNKPAEANTYFLTVLDPPSNMRRGLPRKGEKIITGALTTPARAPSDRSVDWEKLTAISKPIADLKGDAEDEYLYGQELLIAGEKEMAAAHFRRVAILNPNSAFAHENLGDILRNLGRDEEAKDQFVSAYRLTKHWARASLRSKLRVMLVDVEQIEKQSSPSITSKADGQSRSAKNVSTAEQSPQPQSQSPK